MIKLFKNLFTATLLGCLLVSCLDLSGTQASSTNYSSNKKHSIQILTHPQKALTKIFVFRNQALPFNALLHVGIGFLNEDNSKNGLLGDLDESQIESIEIEGSTKADRSVLDGSKLNLKGIQASNK